MLLSLPTRVLLPMMLAAFHTATAAYMLLGAASLLTLSRVRLFCLGAPQVLASPRVAPVTNVLECARRADGGAAIIVASSQFLQSKGLLKSPCRVSDASFACCCRRFTRLA